MAKKKKRVSFSTGYKLPASIETFHLLSPYELNRWSDTEPFVFNGEVGVVRYRVTIEEIPEPDDVIYERLLKLWRESDNHHHWRHLQAAAARIGRELPNSECGKDRRK